MEPSEVSELTAAPKDEWNAYRVWEPESRVVVPDYPFMEDEDDRMSVSFGTVTDGRVYNAAELALPGASFGILPRQAERNLRYATAEMVTLLVDVADQMAARYPDTVLWLGNLGRRHGGDIPYSVSHNAGRDADIAFYYVDELGNPVTPTDLLPVGRDLRTEGPGPTLLFDVERNWALIEALLAHDSTQVQFLFISNPLKRELLRHARSQRVPRRVLERAETVMSQPGRRNPHNDHLHLRLYCSVGDIERGCVNLGRVHPWVETYESERRARLASLREYLSHQDPAQRARAVERLVIFESSHDLSRIALLLDDPEPRVRSVAAAAIGALDGQRWRSELMASWDNDEALIVLAAAAHALVELGGEDVGAFLADRIDEPRVVLWEDRTIDARIFLVDSVAEMGHAPAAPRLVGLLGSDDPQLRSRSLWALERLTNATFGSHWSDAQLDAVSREQGLESWAGWIAELEAAGDASWVELGFARVGFDTMKDGDLDLAMLAHVVSKASPYASYNAQRLLAAALGRDVPSLIWPRYDAAWYWRAAVPP